AQFHEFVPEFIDWGRQNGVIYVPKMRTQPVAARVVAEAVVELALRPGPMPAPGPFGTNIPEIAGPREESSVELARLLVARRGDSVAIEGVTNAADPDSALYEAGALLPSQGAALVGPTFEEWLDSTMEEARSDDT